MRRITIVVVAMVLGLLSGLLLYFELALLFWRDGDAPTLGIVALSYAGWALVTYLIGRAAHSLSRVFARGFLIGPVHWFTFIPIGIVVGSGGVILTFGLVSLLTGSVAIGMVLVCLIGFAIAFAFGREMKAESAESAGDSMACPYCAETIKREAVLCYYCGRDLPAAKPA